MEICTRRRSDIFPYVSKDFTLIKLIFVVVVKVECVAPYDELDWVNMGRTKEGARFDFM